MTSEKQGGPATASPAGGRQPRDWTQGSILRNLLSLAGPMAVNESLWTIGPTVDLIWVGRLGTTAIAGVGVAGMIVMLLTSLRWGIGTGSRAIISRFIGAGDERGAEHAARQAFVVAGLYSIAVAAIGLAFSEQIMRLFGLEAEVVLQGAAYLRIQLVGSVAMSFWITCEGIMYSAGDAVRPMRITIAARLVYLVLDPFLIFGWWIFPEMGVSGAATANLVCYTLGLIFSAWVLFSGRSRIRLTMHNMRLDPAMIWRIVRIGVPSSVIGVERTLGRLMLMRIVSPFGTVAVAAHSLAQRMEFVFYMPTMALATAASILVGQNLGARQPGRAEKGVWLAGAAATIVMVALAIPMLIWAEAVVGVFNREPALVRVASTFIRIEVASYVLMGLSSVLQQSIQGAGDTLPPMFVSITSIWVIQLPLAWVLSNNTSLQVYGARWAIVAGTVVGLLCYLVYFRMGRWKTRRV